MSDSAPRQPLSSSQMVTAALDALFEPINRSDAPGVVVGVSHRGRVIYRRGFGLASVEFGIANTACTRMRIGSTSKHFACVAALLLVDEGRLGLDDGVRKYFPALPVLEGEATVRQLMNHTSGYRDFIENDTIADGAAIKPLGAPLEVILRQREVNFAPGRKAIYNNSGFHLLSLIIEQVAGVPFAQFIKERVLLPVGMVDTECVPSDFEIHRNNATLHVPLAGGGWKRGIFPYVEVLGEGSMISSVDDMLRWTAHLRGSKLVGTDKHWAEMLEPTVLSDGTLNPYGYGLIVLPHRGLRTISHAGGVVGGASEMLVVPEHELDIVIMTNSGLINPPALARQVLEAVLGEAALSPATSKAESAPYQALVGRRYHTASGYSLAFGEHDGVLAASFLNGSPATMRVDDTSLRVGFYEDGAGGPVAIQVARAGLGDPAPASLTVTEGSHAETAELLPATPPPLADVAQGFVGRYAAHDLNAQAKVEIENDRLVLKMSSRYGDQTLVLEAYSGDVLGFTVVGDLPVSGVLTLERTAGVVRAFRASDPRTRRILFERLIA